MGGGARLGCSQALECILKEVLIDELHHSRYLKLDGHPVPMVDHTYARFSFIADCRICVWNAVDGSIVHSLTGHTDSVSNVENSYWCLNFHIFKYCRLLNLSLWCSVYTFCSMHQYIVNSTSLQFLTNLEEDCSRHTDIVLWFYVTSV